MRTANLITRTHGPLGAPFHAEMLARQLHASNKSDKTKLREGVEGSRSYGMRNTVEQLRCEAPVHHIQKSFQSK